MVAIDPSLTHFGIIVYQVSTKKIVFTKTLVTEKETKKRKIYQADDTARRIIYITDGFNEVLKKYKPYIIIAETPSGGAVSSNAATALAIAKSLATIIPRMWGIPLISIMASDAKEAATGKKNGSKALVEEAMKTKYPGTPWDSRKGHNEHQYDAAAVLTAGLTSDLIRL